MNTTALQETSAVATAVASMTGAPEMRLVPLSRLRPSGRNVRKTASTSIPELAASIARLGLLQNLNVMAAADGEHFEVVAGQRRLAALKLLAKRRKLAKDFEVPCMLVAGDAARTVSLTENIQREAMHPADQFEAFAKLLAEGKPIEDIAADFGVTPLVVQRRLKLANVSPRLLADYREGAVTLEQLMALAITDDHAAQEAAFYEAPQWQRSPDSLRDHLTSEEVEAARDPLALWVGVEAYEQAGGAIRRDLFADEQSGVFLSGTALLESLAKEKLAPFVAELQGEGWGWVEAAPRASYGDLHRLRRLPSERRAPTKAEAKAIAKLEAKQVKLQARLDDEGEELSDEEVEAVQDEIDAVGEEIEAAERVLVMFPPKSMAHAGAVVALDHAGRVVVHRGLLRDHDAKAMQAQDREEGGAVDRGASDSDVAGQGKRGISEKLVKQLSAHRTAALQAEVARHPHVALAAIVHRLSLRIILGIYDVTPVSVHANPQDALEQFAPDVGEGAASVGMQKVRDAWAKRLPSDSEALFAELLGMPQDELLSLLAVCVGLTVNAIASREGEASATALAQAVDLDMHAWWTPTAAGYFEHVSKATSLDAVQSFAPGEVARLSKLKKAEIACEAERLAAGTGWLPSLLERQAVPVRSAGCSETDASPEPQRESGDD